MGNVAGSGLCVLGMVAIGAVSLRMSYSSTIRAYRGGYGGAKTASPPKAKESQSTAELFVAKSAPFLSEHIENTGLQPFSALLTEPPAG